MSSLSLHVYLHHVCLQEYLKADSHNRTVDDTGILQVKQGCEPLSFTGYFLAWDNDKWSVSIT